ncbi:RagB/SusD family nutrient uptake outer membrane protein [Olivibacter sp. SDN3]|uniref:RagB/SusD family nutrient uptake outer membrane protein n=1 Tax=Olivibacter sp. SDN3 TaxID=2764720 RepID=UPI00165107F6|nr:RagB/SusD family nutrient uptake outer membrane protein [Olivibacter sp. SDN3]QNL49451.1 RagB/SusD family nutrient uptake outer membrane protein [Olivibacter sp. SDN3]
MKNFIISLLSITLALGSCTKGFLDTEPITDLTDENFYTTPEDAYTALVGCYDGLQIIWAEGISLPVAAEVLSDNCFGGTGNADGFGYQMLDEFDRLRSPADQNIFGPNWEAYYKAVYRCNVLIGKLDDIEWGNETDLRLIYEAEARFIRAYLYFDMVRLWGNIPLLTEPSSENIPQSTSEEVYGVIAGDLQFAIGHLPSTAYAAQSTDTYGRVTKWAAEGLMGRVFLYYTGYYNQSDLVGLVDRGTALNYLEDIIANGGYALVEHYANLWPASLEDYVGEDNQETIFAIKYTYTSDYDGNTDGNHWLVMLGMREQWSFPYGNGWGGATVNPKLWNTYSDADSRKAASIIAIQEEQINFTNQSRQREYTGYYNKKYTPLVDEEGNSIAVNNGAVNFMIGQFQDYVSIRYADILLMAAELGSANAQLYFDAVRQRAYGDNFTALPATPARIMNERHLEFALEGIRYWDLLRQGVNQAANTIAENTFVLNGGQQVSKVINASKINETQGLQQIPYNQINLSNGVLVQNTGW